jgi:hypothetical protein
LQLRDRIVIRPQDSAVGWDLTGVTLFQSGPFLTPSFSNADPSGTGANVRGFTATQRPHQIADGNMDNATADAYFRARLAG